MTRGASASNRYYIMNKICVKGVLSENISLAKSVGKFNNIATTKLSAVKPSRHTLAIFTPKTLRSIGVRHVQALIGLSVYDGLIDLIQYLYGNKSSRLITVVNARCPIWQHSLTKLSGAFPC